VVSFTPRLLYPQGKIPWYQLIRKLMKSKYYFKQRVTDARFEVFTVVKIQVEVFWIVNLKMEAERSSETS
jgi:hypothetical protein